MNRTKLESAISAFVKNKKANAAYYDDNWTERIAAAPRSPYQHLELCGIALKMFLKRRKTVTTIRIFSHYRRSFFLFTVL